MSTYGFPKSERLCGQKPIAELFEKGKPGFVYPFRYLALEADQTAVLIAVPKRNHKKANVRNLLKRRTREAYRLTKPGQTPESLHIGLVYAAKKVEKYDVIQNAIQKILSALQPQNG